MPLPNESAEDAFVRLAQARMTKTMDKMRLVSQLAAPYYSFTPQQADHIVKTLAQSVEAVASSFEVPVSFVVGRDAEIAKRTNHAIISKPKKSNGMDPMDIAMAIEQIQLGHSEDALGILRRVLSQNS